MTWTPTQGKQSRTQEIKLQPKEDGTEAETKLKTNKAGPELNKRLDLKPKILNTSTQY